MKPDQSSIRTVSRRGMLTAAAAGVGAVGFGVAPNNEAYAKPAAVDDMTGRYVPIDSPILASKTIVIRDNKETSVFWSSMTEAERKLQLSNIDSKVTIEKIDKGVTIGFLEAGAQAGKGQYKVTVDYIRFKDELVRQGGAIVGRGKVGVGVRVSAFVTTRKSGINLGGLLPIAIQASQSFLSGSLEIKLIGIVSPDSSKINSSLTELNDSAITRAMEAFGAFRILIDADKTTTVPHLLAMNSSRETPPDMGTVLQSLNAIF